MPRVSSDYFGERCSCYLPGVWAGVLLAVRDKMARSTYRYLDDPRLVFGLDLAESKQLTERARLDADEWYRSAIAAGEPVTVGFATLRGVAPKEFLRQERDTRSFTVHPDDTVVPESAIPF